MFDIGFWELMLVALVALIVLGPERLPKIARTAGQLASRLRKTLELIKRELEAEIKSE